MFPVFRMQRIAEIHAGQHREDIGLQKSHQQFERENRDGEGKGQDAQHAPRKVGRSCLRRHERYGARRS